MEPPLLHLRDMHLTFGGTPLLAGAELQVFPGSRICLVGRNGSGKSTLMKIAAGLIEPDSGERFLQPGTTLRYLHQEPDLTGHATIGDYAAGGLAPGDDPHRAIRLLEALGLDPSRPVKPLSGGEARRAALARALAPEPDILLLDEPTNHLDLPAIEWLEEELAASRSALVMISHDRRFLQSLGRTTVWIDRGTTRVLDRGFDAFEDWRDTVMEEEEIAAHKAGRKIVREEHWVTHGVSGRRKRNMRRLNELADLRKQHASRISAPGNVKISTAGSAQSGKLVAELDHVWKAWGERQVVRDFSIIIRRGDRIGIVGPNGAGKTTITGLISGAVSPDSGSQRLGTNLQPLIIDQNRESLDPAWTLRQALTDGAGDMVALGDTRKHVIAYMKDYLFVPEQAGTPVHALSGGERARLLLARGLRNPSNFLILDEPTNDLDLETLDLLQEFLATYEGTVLLVSHDRDFLDRICTAIIAHDGEGRWQVYAGGYSDMRAQKRGAGARQAPATRSPEPGRKEKASSEEASPVKPKPAGKLSFKQKHALETLPGEIARLESEISKLERALEDPGLYSREPAKFAKFTDALAQRQASLAQKEELWLELEMMREEGGG